MAGNFGSLLESDTWLEMVEEGSADTIEGKAVDEFEVPEWEPAEHASPITFGVRMSQKELAQLEAEEEAEDMVAFVMALQARFG